MTRADLDAEAACWRMFGLIVTPHYFGLLVHDPRTHEARPVYA